MYVCIKKKLQTVKYQLHKSLIYKDKLNSEMIWKTWKKSKLNSEKIWKIQKKIMRRQGKYGRKQ